MANVYPCRSRTHAAELDLSNVKHDLRAFIQEYKDGSRDIKQLISSECLMTRKHVSTSSKETIEAIDGVQKQVTRLTIKADVHIDQAKRERLLRSLKFPAFNDRRNQVSEAHENTFEWIFLGDDGPSQEDLSGSDLEDSDWEDSDLEDLDLADPSEASWDLFSNWLSSTADIYWISGKPGSGKTTLVKYILDHPRTTTYLNTWAPHSLVISHFFWRPDTLMQQSIKGLLCSLLYQLLDNSVAAAGYVLQNIQTGRSGMKDEDADWSIPELRSMFLKVLQSYERPIFLFIDGLDEVHPADGPVELVDLVEEVARCRNTKLCLSSRPEPILEERLSTYPHLRLQDLTEPDLQLYAQDRVKLTVLIDNEAQSTGFKDGVDLINLLVDKAEGVFLWLVLAIKSINKGFTYGDTSEMIRQRIDRLPGDSTTLYKDMWARACEDNPVAYRQMAALYFRLILLSKSGDEVEPPYWSSNLLLLMLASTSVADQLLDAINKPSELVTEEKLMQSCREVERGLKLYCFGLIEVIQSPNDEPVIGWYGTRYNTLWSRYGRRELQFVHRTAQDFLLDTVDGSEILKHNSTPENSLFLRLVRADLATNQLYAEWRSYASQVTPFIHLLEQEDCYPGDPDRTRTIFYIQDLCRSGQLLCERNGALRSCIGMDAFNATATICDGHLLSRSNISDFSKSAVSEILLNVCDRSFAVSGDPGVPFEHLSESSIVTLLSEGADPNWRGTMFQTPGCRLLSGHSLVRTSFTEYLTFMLNLAVCRRWSYRRYQMATILRNLHAFLSCSANLGDAIHRVFSYNSNKDEVYEHEHVWSALRKPWPDKSQDGKPRSEPLHILIVAFPAYIILKSVLDHLSTEAELSWHREEKNFGEMMSLLVRNREYLSNWSEQDFGHPRVIGRLAYNGVADSSVAEDSPFDEKGWFYWSLEGHEMYISNELMGEIEKCLVEDRMFKRNARKAWVITQVLQLPWTLQATSGNEIQELLTKLGILARTDCETHDIQGWVDKFQAKLLADGRVVD